LNVFVVRNVAPEIPLADIFRGCVPFVIVEVLLVGALILWPGMTTVLMQGR
jgi:TRAP-type mannitol/chloroaromatic compound transport system permease large subunit